MPLLSRLPLTVLLVAGAAGAVPAQEPVAPPVDAPTQAAPAPPVASTAPDQPAPATPAVPLALGLDGPVAMVFHVVKGDRGPDFEQLFARLQAGLAASANEVRRQQAAGWRLLKQNAPTAEGHLVYVSVVEPVVAGQEYDMARLLAEAYPDEGLALYQTLIAVHVQPTVQASNVTPVAVAAGGQP